LSGLSEREYRKRKRCWLNVLRKPSNRKLMRSKESSRYYSPIKNLHETGGGVLKVDFKALQNIFQFYDKPI